MRYLATRNVRVLCRTPDRRRQSIVTVVGGDVAPAEVTADDARPFVERGFLREVSDEQAAQVLAGPRPASLDQQAQRAFLAGI